MLRGDRVLRSAGGGVEGAGGKKVIGVQWTVKRGNGMRICGVDGCDEKYLAHGLCTKHWKRWKKYGDPLALKKASWTESPKICKYPGCDRRVHAHFSCRKHTYYYAKIEVIEHYGGKCSCCGENRIEFLCLDHWLASLMNAV